MTTLLYRSISEPIREDLNWEQRWNGPENGLIYCWERGRQLRLENPEIAARADDGELVMLWWRGGVEQKLKGSATKFGTLFYLATWQGLRDENLEIDMDNETVLICSKSGQAVTYCSSSLNAEEQDLQIEEVGPEGEW